MPLAKTKYRPADAPNRLPPLSGAVVLEGVDANDLEDVVANQAASSTPSAPTGESPNMNVDVGTDSLQKPPCGPEADDAREFLLAPPQGKTVAQLQAEMREPIKLEDVNPSNPFVPREGVRYSLGEVMLTVTLAAIGLSGIHWLPDGWFVGIFGPLAFLGLLYALIAQPENRMVRRVLWSVTIIYFGAAAASLAITLSKP